VVNVCKAHQRFITICDPSGVGEARREMAGLGASIALEPARAGELALAVTEAATNIAKHAGGGIIVGRILERDALSGIEVLAIDTGSGMANLGTSMKDGHSTSGTPGQGLGALSRVTSGMEIWSCANRGTILRFEIWPNAGAPQRASTQVGVLCKEKAGETACGDGWAVLESRGRVVAFVGDGLGHGPEAAAAVQTAIATVEKHPNLDAAPIMEAVHAALRSTRGAAGAVAVIDTQGGQCDYCGVGNISAAIRSSGKSHSLVSNNGTLGHHIRKLQTYRYAFPANALLIAHSDGIATHWDLSTYPGLEGRHPAIAAATLFRDHSRGRDDATILALCSATAGRT
jgi:anti-sigma regulatory factor (Ser/Thr protein kinase)